MLAIEGVVPGALPLPLPFDADAATRHIQERDPVLRAVIDQVGPFRIRLEPAPSLFFVLGRSIVYQQLSGKAASTIHARYRMLFDGAMPTPEGLASLSDAKLRGSGISGNKALALRDLAKKAGELPTMRALGSMSDEEIIASLTKVRGIGRWTVQMVLMFRLGRPDVLPVDDYGVRKGFQKVYGTRDLPTADRMSKQADKWAPYRSVGSWYMWRALETP
jgi:3-methyladenine DNA glycosylase/8-oxoguanine DNA glycosylase